MELTGQQLQAIAALLSGGSADAAARAACVSTRTIRRWRSQENFRDEMHRQANALVSQAVDNLKAGMADAVRVLVEVATDDEQPGWNRVQAAGKILEYASRLAQDGLAEHEEKDVPTFVWEPDARIRLHEIERKELDAAGCNVPQILLGVTPKRYEPEISQEVRNEVERLLLVDDI